MGLLDIFSSEVKFMVYIEGHEEEVKFPKDVGHALKPLEGKHFKNRQSFENACEFMLFCDRSTKSGTSGRAQMRNTLGKWCQEFANQRKDCVDKLNTYKDYPFRTSFFQECVQLYKKRVTQYDNDIEIKGNICQAIDSYEAERRQRKGDVF